MNVMAIADGAKAKPTFSPASALRSLHTHDGPLPMSPSFRLCARLCLCVLCFCGCQTSRRRVIARGDAIAKTTSPKWRWMPTIVFKLLRSSFYDGTT